MIQNLKQYKITRKAQNRFKKSLQKMEAYETKDRMDQIIIDATKSILDEMDTNVKQFIRQRNELKLFGFNN